jgi:hypothetical protein
MPAPVDIILSQKKQQQQEELYQVSQGSLARDSAFDFYDFTPTLFDASESSSDDDYYPHDLEANFCRDFSCCGLVLRDLHDLLQHYEECHVRFEEEDPAAMGYAQHAIDDWQAAASDESRPSSPMPVRDALMARQLTAATALKRQSLSATAAAAAMSGVNLNDVLSQQHQGAGMDFDMVDPMETTLLGRKRTASSMAQFDSSNDSANKRMATGVVMPMPLSPPMQQQTFVDDELLLAALLQIGSGSMGTEEMLQDALLLQQQLLLSGRNTSLTSDVTIPNGMSASASNIATTDPSTMLASASVAGSNNNNNNVSTAANPSSTTITRPIATPVGINARANMTNNGTVCPSSSVERPYRCAVPGCEKSYKNANGLKYHNLHGHCNGTANVNAVTHTTLPVVNNAMLHTLDNSLSGAVRGAQVKPYRCTIPECGKSYKNLNGLKYHVEHAHPGAVALPLGKKAHVKAAATVIAQAQERLQMSNIKAVVVPANMVANLNLGVPTNSINGSMSAAAATTNEMVDILSIDDTSSYPLSLADTTC